MTKPHTLALALFTAVSPIACAPSEAAATPHHGAATGRASGAVEVKPKPRPTITATATIDLNHATVEELDRLPGVGKKRAEAIVAHRARRRFRTVEELRTVKGIGPKLFRRLRPLLRADPSP